MPAPASPFPHLDALQAILDRAAGEPTGGGDRLGPSLFGGARLTAGTLTWPWEHAHRVAHAWAQWTRTVPYDVTSVARLVRLPHLPPVPAGLRGRALVAIEVAIPREPWIAAGRLAPLRRLEPVLDTVGVHRPETIHPLHTAVRVGSPALADHVALEALPPAALDAFLAIAGPQSGANLLTAALHHLGRAYGASAAGVPVDADDAARLDIRLGLLTGRLAPYAAGRAPVEDVARAAVLLGRRGEG